MPAKPSAILDSPSGDVLEELNEEYQGGQWAVVNLASLQSIPLSDFGHTPYGQDSHYLDTFSVLGVSGGFSSRPAAAPMEMSSVSPLVPPLNGKKVLRKDMPTGNTPRQPAVFSARAPGVGGAASAKPNAAAAEDEKESSRVVASLVRRELAKQPADESTAHTTNAHKDEAVTMKEPPALPKVVVSPRSVVPRRSSQDNGKDAAVKSAAPTTTTTTTAAVAPGADVKPWQEKRRSVRHPPRRPAPRVPQPPPRAKASALRPLAQTVEVAAPTKHPPVDDEEASPTVVQSMRDLTNARKMPMNAEEADKDGVQVASRPPTASESKLSDLHEDTPSPAKTEQRPPRWRAPPSYREPTANEQDTASGRGPVRLAEFNPITSQRGPESDTSTSKDPMATASSTAAPTECHNPQTATVDLKAAAAAVPRRTSRRTSLSVPSMTTSTVAPSPTANKAGTNGISVNTSTTLSKSKGSPQSTNDDAVARDSTEDNPSAEAAAAEEPITPCEQTDKKRKPLCVPLPPALPPPTLAAGKADLRSPSTSVPTAKERAATASQERLIAFVRAVSDPEVLHVIHDYITEKKGDGRQYREAARICQELLQSKEKLLEDAGAAPAKRSAHVRGGSRQMSRPLVANEEDDAAAEHYPTRQEEEEAELADEFGDLNFTDTPYPEIPSEFQFGEPTVLGTPSRVFKEGLLFKIKDSRGDYYFYNDTLNQVMMVRTQCVLLGNERINERALLTPLEADNAVTEITIAVLPEETNFLMGNCKRLPRVMAKAVVTPDDFTSPSVTKFMTHMNGEINKVRAALGQWSKATDQRAYLKCCLKNKLKFTDLDFRPGALSLYRPKIDYVRLPALTWRRPEEYLAFTEVAETRLFRGEISCHLVKQGELNDHTVVAAIAAIAQFPHHVMWMFRHPTNGETGKRERLVGCYRVTLLKDGWWTNVIVDDYVPASMKGPLFAHCPADPRRLWVGLLEKAYAKVHGSYSAICLVDVLDALGDFTGFPVRSVDTQWQQAQAKPAEAPSQSLFRYLQRCMASGYLVLLYTPAADDEQASETVDLSRKRSLRILPVDGVVPQFLPGHVYFLSDAAHYKELDLRMVRLKNPWTWETGNTNAAGTTAATAALQKRWKYTGWYERPDQSFTSAMSTTASHAGGGGTNAIRSLTAMASDDEEERKGTMWLEWEEALKAFAGGGVCYTVWRHKHYRVRNSFGAGFPDFVLEVNPVKVKTELLLSLTMESPDTPEASPQPQEPSQEPKQQDLCGITLTVSKRVRRVGKNSVLDETEDEEEVCAMACEDVEYVAAKTTYVKAKTVTLKVTLEPNAAPYHIIPRIDPDDAIARRKAGQSQLPFVIGILSSVPVEGGDLGIHFKRIPRTSPVFSSDAKRFRLSASSCGPYTATYQCCDDDGVSTRLGEGILPSD